MTSSWDDAQQAAQVALSKQKWNKALAALAPWLRGDEAALEGAAWSGALTSLAAAVAPFDETVQRAAEQAAARPEDAGTLHALGHALVEARRPDLAVAILARAVAAVPGDASVLAELVAALELLGRGPEAVAALDDAAELVEGDPLLSYLRAFNSFVVGDLDTPRLLLPRLRAATDPRFVFMAARIERMLARADACTRLGRLGPDDLRGWHFVMTAGLLLRTPRQGRTWDTVGSVKDGAQRLRNALEALQLAVPAVLFPPERNSEITARVVAAALGCSASAWHGGDERGLLVVYDARALIPELREPLLYHRPGQRLFMQAAEHTTEQPVASDALTYLYQHNTSPWGPGLSPENRPIDTTSIAVAELVQTVLDAPEDGEGESDRADIESFARSLRDAPAAAAPALCRDDGQRERLWVGSPVRRD